MCCKLYHIIFSTFSLKFKCKISVQKEVIHNFKNHILVTWPATNLHILRKWCGFENQITIMLFKIWPTNRFSKAKSYNFYFHKNDVTWPLSANGLVYCTAQYCANAPELQKKNYWSALFQKWLCAPCNWHSTWREVSTVVHETSCEERYFVLKWHSG